jgi:hypothetical protein
MGSCASGSRPLLQIDFNKVVNLTGVMMGVAGNDWAFIGPVDVSVLDAR